MAGYKLEEVCKKLNIDINKVLGGVELKNNLEVISEKFEIVFYNNKKEKCTMPIMCLWSYYKNSNLKYSLFRRAYQWASDMNFNEDQFRFDYKNC